MNKSDRTVTLLFLLILFLSAAIRLFDIGSFSLSNDELSALYRLDYPNLSELINQGVVETDPHPAGVQVFLYLWTKLFGLTAFAFRLPFVLAGSVGLFFLFLTFRFWFDEQKALLTIAFYAFMEFSMIHSQLARPYAFGLMSVALFTWSWTYILFSEDKKRLHLLIFVISAALSCYIHYYAGLMVGIIGLTGLFIAYKKKILALYFLLGLAAALLFMPHISITIAQLSRGALTSWIDPPTTNFIWEHSFQLLNNSYLLVVIYLGLMLLSVAGLNRNRDRLAFSGLSLLFFLSPMVIGFIYSRFFGAVLMDRVLSFSAPFFFSFAIGGLPVMNRVKLISGTLLLTVTGLLSTGYQTGFFDRDYVENFKGLAADLQKVEAETDKDNVLLIGNFNSEKYINYYLKKHEVTFAITSLDSDDKLADFMEKVKSSTKNSMAIFWACKYQPIAALEYAKLYYPELKMHKNYFNSGMWQFDKGNQHNQSVILDEIPSDTVLHADVEFLNLLKIEIKELSTGGINVRAFYNGQNTDDVLLVFAISSQNGESKFWQGHHLSNFSKLDGVNEIFSSLKVPKEVELTDMLTIYFWNPGKKEVLFNGIELSEFHAKVYPQLY